MKVRPSKLFGSLFLLLCAGLMLWGGLSQMTNDGFGPTALRDAQQGQGLLLIFSVPTLLAGWEQLGKTFRRKAATRERS